MAAIHLHPSKSLWMENSALLVKLLVRGADPDDVDIMESQTRIMRRLAEGDLEIVDFEITMYDDGSDETVSETEWLGPCECVHCGWTGDTEKARTFHDE